LTQGGGGIVASISTTTYLDSPPAVAFMKDLLKATRTAKTTWGEALVKAQQAAAKNSKVTPGAQYEENSYTDLVKSECLLGDPALKVLDSKK
ncbi:MAG: hypothetical protein KIS92_26865, partial [Planctomycetota bacterium]|nr:hypothetical protein [Planctomycetota bacterium]